jgi:GrpB-like predicted nucleotidyltransferase (UPF0157 family)
MPPPESEAQIEVVPYNPLWPSMFLDEQSVLQVVLAPWLVGEVEHVGSTAVPGLAAKPVIDIMAPVHTLAASQGALEAAKSIGYVYYPYKQTEMRWFCKPSAAHRTHHLHIVPLASKLWHERLAFRDALRSNPQLAQAYAMLKFRLAEQYRNDREAYTEAKAPFIHAALQASCAGNPSAA